MDEALEAQRRSYLTRLDALETRGRALCDLLRDDPADERKLADTRLWQRDCAVVISDLSGGRKTHWLSRAFSEAFLISVPEPAPQASTSIATEAPVDVIVSRVIGVLEQAKTSLAEMSDAPQPMPESSARPSRYVFVRNRELQLHLEQADLEAERAFGEHDHALALVGWASVLEALITNALEEAPAESLRVASQSEGPVAAWSFDQRIAVAEKARLVSAACARLPAMARGYRECLDSNGEIKPDMAVAEDEARRVKQVLNVVRRDLSPGR